MLVKHRLSAYMDAGEMERAAGLFEINAKKSEEPVNRSVWRGAAMVLRLMQVYDIEDAEALEKRFCAAVFGGGADA